MGLSRSLLYGVAAGAGTAAMTAAQLAVRKARGEPLGTPVPRTWADAPAPAQLAKKAATAAGHRNAVTKRQVPLLTNTLHWAYGISWGAAYGVAAHALRPHPLAAGPALGVGVWAASYAEFVPLGIYRPPWEYPPSELALDLGYHLAYGAGVAGSYAWLRRR